MTDRSSATVRCARVALAFILALVVACPSQALIHAADATECAPGVDLLGFSDALDGTEFDGLPVGGLSAIVYDARQDVYYSLVDNDGTNPARIYTLHMTVGATGISGPAIQGVTLLHGADGTLFDGESSDNEGLALLPDGGFLVSSETEPAIRHFAADGSYVERLAVPERFLIANGLAEPNATFESLTLSPDSSALYTALEGPLSSDGQTEAGAGRNRILRYDVLDGAFQPAAEFVYEPEPSMNVSDMLALSATDVLVLERGVSFALGFTIRVYRISTEDATDVSGLESLGDAAVEPLTKHLLFDLADCPADDGETFGFGSPLLENFEGLAFGPVLNGRQTLVLQSDDNFESFLISRIIVVAAQPGLVGGSADPAADIARRVAAVPARIARWYW